VRQGLVIEVGFLRLKWQAAFLQTRSDLPSCIPQHVGSSGEIVISSGLALMLGSDNIAGCLPTGIGNEGLGSGIRGRGRQKRWASGPLGGVSVF